MIVLKMFISIQCLFILTIIGDTLILSCAQLQLMAQFTTLFTKPGHDQLKNLSWAINEERFLLEGLTFMFYIILRPKYYRD